MAKPTRSMTTLVSLATLTLVVVALYFGRPVLMPLALAVLLSFLLSPVADALHRLGVGRKTSVVFLVLLVFLFFGTGAYIVGIQLNALAHQLPAYKDNIREKVLAFRAAGKDSALEQLQETVAEIQGEVAESEKRATNKLAEVNPPEGPLPLAETPADFVEEEAEAAEEEQPVPVVVRGETSSPMWQVPTALGPLLELLATLALVIVLIIFMLLRRRELRNRFILLFGYERMPTTTQALDEAGARISRYLLMQTIINSTYGVAVGIGLYFIGVPYALLWAFLAAALRFIPYVGPWLGAAMPVLLSLAVFPGWVHPFLVIGLILVMELTTNMILEPLLYGQTAGVSEVALLVAVAFWTWVWGPFGLALATPLTVCLVVLGKYVPGLGFIHTILGDEAVMNPQLVFYQRLLAMDKAEAEEIAAAFRKNHEPSELFDDLLLPALISTRRDLGSQCFTGEDLAFIHQTVLGIIQRETPAELETSEEPLGRDPDLDSESHYILCIPAEDRLDELVALMLKCLLPRHQVEVIPSKPLSGELMEVIARCNPEVVCITSIAPGNALELRHLTKRIQLRFPELRVIVERAGMQNRKRSLVSTLSAHLTTTVSETKNLVLQLLQLQAGDAGAKPMPPAVRARGAQGEVQHN